MTTFIQLRQNVATALRDPSNVTFTDPVLKQMVLMGVAEVGRAAPRQFQQDISPVANTLTYTPMSAYFGGVATPEIEVSRVELWDSTATPDMLVATLPAASAGYIAESETGWSMWGGILYIPRRIQQWIAGAEANYLYRVWGYAPYAIMSADSDIFDGSDELMWGVVSYCRVEGIEMLVNDRDLFSQWQTHSGNTDASYAGLLNDRNGARSEWRMRSRALTRLRSKV